MLRHIASFKADFLDRSTKTWKSETKATNIVKVATPALVGAITTFSDIIGRLQIGLPLQFFLPFYLFLGCATSIWIIKAKQVRHSSPARSRTFRFPQELRQSSKLALPFFILMLGFSIANLLPNFLHKDQFVSGILCNPKHDPISQAAVSAIDRFGRTASLNVESTDDEGYFFLDLDLFAQPPTELKVSFGRCASVLIPISSASLSTKNCRQDRLPSSAKFDTKYWVLTCQD